jgi:uncharacterized protein YdaU (DUF1376 family)
MNYYHRHLGDYAKDTGHLTTTEHGAYNLLLDRYYATEKGIPADQVYRVTKATTKADKAATKAVLAEFFNLVGGTWIKDRCEEEIRAGQHRIEQARLNGRKGGRMGTQRDTQRVPSGLPDGVTLQSPVSNLQSKEKESEAKNGLAREETREVEAFARSFAGSHRVPRG